VALTLKGAVEAYRCEGSRLIYKSSPATQVVLVVSWDIILYFHGIVVEDMSGVVGR
jgi:hypothetical protein